jgi:hypothetical protein
VHLEASTKPHVHQKFQIFWTNIAFTMAYPNFKNGPKNGLGPLGVKIENFPEKRSAISLKFFTSTDFFQFQLVYM